MIDWKYIRDCSEIGRNAAQEAYDRAPAMSCEESLAQGMHGLFSIIQHIAEEAQKKTEI